MERKEVIGGTESFEELITGNLYYVDKTDFIINVFGPRGAKVQLITRPRRFGKTFTMSTFESFLSLNPDSPGDVSKQLRLFEGTHILSDEGTPEEVSARKRFVRDHMGKYPVIFLSLKDVHGDSFEQAYQALATAVRQQSEPFRYLKSSSVLDEDQRIGIANVLKIGYLGDPAHESELKSSLKDLCIWLTAQHGVAPIVLIDEYDVPLAKAEAKGYYEQMLDLLKQFLSALKTNAYMSRAVLTGCLRISKESIFTGLNNFSTNSIFDDASDAYSSAIGFTKEETETLLEYCGLGKYKDKVRENYDGYRFGGISMFCPWDVLCFCEKAIDKVAKGQEPRFDDYWTNTSGNDIIDAFADYISPEHIDDMQTLVDGGSIAVTVRVSLNYPDLKKHEIDAFWTMLLYTGYLTLSQESSFNLKEPQQVRIPNLEIRDCFRERILGFFESSETGKSYAKAVAQAAVGGDADEVALTLMNYMQIYISIRDLATRAPHEDYYHGMLNALIGGSGMAREYRSNQEAGEGYADISFISSDQRTAVVIELKQTKNEREMDSQASSAVEQIIAKDYAGNYLARSLIKNVYAYGICFCRKSCSVSVKILKCPDTQKA